MVASVADACRESVVITMLANDNAVEGVVLGKGGIIDSLPNGGIHISSSTISVALSEALATDAEGEAFMSDQREDQERPRLHCLIVELIDDFFAEYPPAPGGSDKVDTEEGRNHRGGRGEDKSRSGRRCWRCYRIWPGGGLAVSFAMAKAKSGIGNAVRRAVKHGIETVSSSCG